MMMKKGFIIMLFLFLLKIEELNIQYNIRTVSYVQHVNVCMYKGMYIAILKICGTFGYSSILLFFFVFFWEVHIRAHTSTYVWRTNLHFQYV